MAPSIIIGAGIAGLSAGCYGQMNGYQTRICEAHDKPGGLCTAWRRGDYTVNGSLRWLVGFRPGTSFYRIWQELDAVEGQPMLDYTELKRIERPDGKTFIAYADIDRLAQHLKQLAPADSELIDEFAEIALSSTRFNPPLNEPRELFGLGDLLRLMGQVLPYARLFLECGHLSIERYAARFSDPFLREVLPLLVDLPDFPALGLFMTLAYLHNRDTSYPIGGSLAFARRIERRYLQLGGQLQYQSPVVKVLVEAGRAVGVRLANGTEQRADVVISAADGHETIFDLLDGQYLDDNLRRTYQNFLPQKPVVLVALGVARDLSEEPHSVVRLLDQPIWLAGVERKWLTFEHFGFDPTLAPPGKSLVVCMSEGNYAYWQQLARDRARYEAEKEQVAGTIIAHLDRRWPGIARQIEMVDVATPVTTERFTHNWQGSVHDWAYTTKLVDLSLFKGMPKTLPGLENFYMAGQWVEPGGGVPLVAASGRNVIQLLCHREKRPFTTQIA